MYEPFSASRSFEVTYDVCSTQLAGFCLKLAGSEPFFGSTDCITFEMDATVEAKGFEISRLVSGYPLYGGWCWGTFCQPTLNEWYTLKITVNQSPFEVVYQVYANGTLYGMARASDMSNIGFSDIHYLVLECWAGGTYQVKNFAILPQLSPFLFS